MIWTEPNCPFVSSEVETPIGLGVTLMGVSTSFDTNGIGAELGRCRFTHGDLNSADVAQGGDPNDMEI